jgi:hypothetical protein
MNAPFQSDLERPHREDPLTRPKIGEAFNPYRKLCGFYPPDLVGRQRDLTDGQKRLYERAVRWAGTNGSFWRSFANIAEELGKSVRQVKDDMATLEQKRLIGHTRRRRRSNVYHFQWHPIFEVQPTARQAGSLKVQNSILEVQDTVKNRSLEVQPAAPESCPSLNFVNMESSSGAAASVQESATVAPTDDDPPLSHKTENPTSWDRHALVETARKQLRMTRAAGMGNVGVFSPETPAQTSVPDPTITLQILECFPGYDDFTFWLKDTLKRGVARKAKDSTRWGLYLADAKNHAEEIPRRRQTDQQRRITAEAAEAKCVAAKAQAAAEMARPMSAFEAYCRIQRRVQRGVPKPLKAQLERTDQLIAPCELERQILAWNRCPKCSDVGLLGNAIDRDLRFCDCPAGREAQNAPTAAELAKAERFHRGPDYPEREIKRVHSDSQSLLVASCRVVGLEFAGAAIENSSVSDDGTTLIITLGNRACALQPTDVEGALIRINWRRIVQIDVPPAAKSGSTILPSATPEATAPAKPITQRDIDVELLKAGRLRIKPDQSGPPTDGTKMTLVGATR